MRVRLLMLSILSYCLVREGMTLSGAGVAGSLVMGLNLIMAFGMRLEGGR